MGRKKKKAVTPPPEEDEPDDCTLLAEPPELVADEPPPEETMDDQQRRNVKDEETSSDNDAPLFVRTDWSEQKRRGVAVVRCATKPQQNKYIGKKVVTSWGGKLYTGKVTAVYNATAEYAKEELKRDLYTVTWDEDQLLDEDQLTEEKELEELENLIEAAQLPKVHAAREKNPHSYGPKPMELNPEPVVWGDNVKRQKTSMARKGNGGNWHIPRAEYADHTHDMPGTPGSRKVKLSGPWVDDELEMSEETQEERREWVYGPIDRELPEFLGKTPGPTEYCGVTKGTSPADCFRKSWPQEYLDDYINEARGNYFEAKAKGYKKRVGRAQAKWTWDSVERAFWNAKEGSTDDKHLWVTADHFFHFLCIKQLMAFENPLKPYRDIFSTDPMVRNGYICDRMTVDQYQWFVRFGYHPDIGDSANT